MSHKWIKPAAASFAETAIAAGKSVEDYARERAYDPEIGETARVVLVETGHDVPAPPRPPARTEVRYGKV